MSVFKPKMDHNHAGIINWFSFYFLSSSQITYPELNDNNNTINLDLNFFNLSSCGAASVLPYHSGITTPQKTIKSLTNSNNSRQQDSYINNNCSKDEADNDNGGRLDQCTTKKEVWNGLRTAVPSKNSSLLKARKMDHHQLRHVSGINIVFEENNV